MNCNQIPYQGFTYMHRPVVTFRQKVCSLFEVTDDQYYSKGRRGNTRVSYTKEVLAYYYRVIKGFTWAVTARKLNKKDHTSVYHILRAFQNDYETNREFRNKCKLLRIEL